MDFCELELLCNLGLLNDMKLVISGIYLIEALILYIIWLNFRVFMFSCIFRF